MSSEAWEISSLGQKEEAIGWWGEEGEVDGGMCNSNKLERTEQEEEITNSKEVWGDNNKETEQIYRCGKGDINQPTW